MAVVFDLEGEAAGIEPQAQPGGRGVGVFDDVVDGFLGRQKYVMAELGRNRDVGKLRRNFQTIAQRRQREVFLGVFADVIDQAVQGVIGWINGPDDLIKGAGGFEGSLRDLAAVGRDLRRLVFVAFHHLAQGRPG